MANDVTGETYLNKSGLLKLWAKIKSVFATKTELTDGLSKKQNTLTSQTAYSAKGSATKVPQITTNSLGQVTSITEVSISQPSASSTAPKMDGTAGVGTESSYARADHVHPTDTSRASSTHTHGNITNGGALQTNDVTIASGDKLVITDSSDSGKVARASISFDGSTATQALTKKGTWETFNNYTHPTTSGNKHLPSGGADGQFLGWSADGTAKWVANPNTDYRVKQSATTTANYRPLLMGARNETTHTTFETEATDQSYASNKLYAQPSTGLLGAGSFRINDKADISFNSTDNCIDFTFS